MQLATRCATFGPHPLLDRKAEECGVQAWNDDRIGIVLGQRLHSDSATERQDDIGLLDTIADRVEIFPFALPLHRRFAHVLALAVDLRRHAQRRSENGCFLRAARRSKP